MKDDTEKPKKRTSKTVDPDIRLTFNQWIRYVTNLNKLKHPKNGQRNINTNKTNG